MTETDLVRLQPVASAAEPVKVTEMEEPEEVLRFEALDVRPVRSRLAGAGRFDLEFDGDSIATEREEVYFETADWRLHRAGYTLRFLLEGGAERAVLTTIGTDESIRSALQVAHPAGLVESFLSGSGAANDRVRALVGSRSLGRLFSLRSRIETFSLRREGEHAGRIRLVETSVPVPGNEPPMRLSRVEFVPAKAAPDSFLLFARELRSACGLRSVAVSDREAGLLAVGLTPPGAWSFGPTTVDRTLTIGALSFSVLRDQFARVLAHEPGTRIGVDIEELHDMRVATRRMRAALMVFGRYLPERAATFSLELRWLGQALGDVRDLDVQLEQLAEWRGSFDPSDRNVFEPIESALSHQRQQARAKMLDELDSSRYENLVTRMTEFLKEGPDPTYPAGRPLAVTIAPQLVESWFDRVSKKGKRLKPSSEPKRFHRLRIDCKVLRYVLEFSTGLYGRDAERMIGRLKEVQDLLGQHQDADVAVVRIRHLAQESVGFPPAAVFLLGRLSERYDREADRLRRRFPQLRKRLGGKRWNRLQIAMHSAAGLPADELADGPTLPY